MYFSINKARYVTVKARYFVTQNRVLPRTGCRTPTSDDRANKDFQESP